MRNHLRFVVMAVVVAAGSMIVSADGQLLPSSPKKAFGASISPAFEGWYDNPDGSHTFLIGYYNRNWNTETDVPIGPSNRFEPGDRSNTAATRGTRTSTPMSESSRKT